jgi:hypothetical protein
MWCTHTLPNPASKHDQELRVGWGSDPDEFESAGHHWLHIWIDEGMTGQELYTGLRRAGVPCTDACVVREASAEEPEGVGALAFRQVSPFSFTVVSNSEDENICMWGPTGQCSISHRPGLPVGQSVM